MENPVEMDGYYISSKGLIWDGSNYVISKL